MLVSDSYAPTYVDPYDIQSYEEQSITVHVPTV